jgi:hypothetical protein
MDMEFRKIMAEYDRKNAVEVDAIILWTLHEVFGFGPIRLKRFYDAFAPAMDELVKRYEMEETDQVWLCTHMLESYLSTYDIKLEDWQKEQEAKASAGA